MLFSTYKQAALLVYMRKYSAFSWVLVVAFLKNKNQIIIPDIPLFLSLGQNSEGGK